MNEAKRRIAGLTCIELFAMFADGVTRFVSEEIDPELLRRLIERDDGE